MDVDMRDAPQAGGGPSRGGRRRGGGGAGATANVQRGQPNGGGAGNRGSPYDRSRRAATNPTSLAAPPAAQGSQKTLFPPPQLSIRGSGGPYWVCISNLMNGTTADDIRTTFEDFGKILDVRLRPPPSVHHVSSAYEIAFERREDAALAIEKFNGALADGRVISLVFIQFPSTGGAIPGYPAVSTLPAANSANAAFGDFNQSVSKAAKERLRSGQLQPGPSPLPRAANAYEATGRDGGIASAGNGNTRAASKGGAKADLIPKGSKAAGVHPAGGPKAHALPLASRMAPPSLQYRLSITPGEKTAGVSAPNKAITVGAVGQAPTKRNAAGARGGTAAGAAIAPLPKRKGSAASPATPTAPAGTLAARIPPTLHSRISVPLEERLSKSDSSISRAAAKKQAAGNGPQAKGKKTAPAPAAAAKKNRNKKTKVDGMSVD